MGLDVYCEWPNMTSEEKQAQFTGFQDAGSAGYLRQSWGSLEAWNEVFKSVFGTPWDEMLYPTWKGGNDGNGPDLTDSEQRERLATNRDKLLAYIKNRTSIPVSMRKYFGEDSWPDAGVVVAKQAKEVSDFITLALSKEGAKIKFS